MSVTPPTPPPAPISERAARNGLFLGIYICVLVVASGLSVHYAAASFLVWGGSLALPFFLYRLIRRNHRDRRTPTFPELWAEGIGSFFLATLLPALLTYSVLRFAMPAFITDTIAQSAAMLRTIGSAEWSAMADTMDSMIAQGKVPTPADVTSQLISFNIIAGTVLSLIVGIVIALKTAIESRKASDRGQQNC